MLRQQPHLRFEGEVDVGLVQHHHPLGSVHGVLDREAAPCQVPVGELGLTRNFNGARVLHELGSTR